MKILHTVEFYLPSTGGAQEVVRQLSERMVAMGHDVTVATTKLPERTQDIINGVKVVGFDVRGNQVVGMMGETEKYKDFLRTSNFDVMMNYAAQQWATDLAFEAIDDISAKKVIVPCGYSALHNSDFDKYFDGLPLILKKYSASIYLTKNYQDYRFAKQHRLRHLKVIPNGADEKEFSDLASRVDFRKAHDVRGFFILNISNHTGSKGHAETLESFAIFPHSSTLVIIGRSEDDGCYKACQKEANRINMLSSDKKVLLLTLPRVETVAALKSADVFLFLSNVEASPLVLFEAVAAGLPFVSADVGNAREIARWTKGGVIVPAHPDTSHDGNVIANPASAANLLETLYTNQKLRNKLGKNGRKNWKKRFTWEKITKDYLKLYKRICR